MTGETIQSTVFFASNSIPLRNPQHSNQKRKFWKGNKHSYTNSYTKNKLSEVGREDFQKWNRSAQKVDFVIAGSIKFENLIAGSCKTVIHIVIQKSGQNTKKPQQNDFYCGFLVVSPGIEPGTQGFSVLCSTNWAMTPVVLFGIAKVGIIFYFANFF